MSQSLNVRIVTGNLGNDAKIRTVGENNVTEFSVAVTESYKDKQGNWVNSVSWEPVVLWNPSDYQVAHLKKGAHIEVSGRIRRRTYNDKDGVERMVVETIANTVQISKEAGTNGSTDNAASAGSQADISAEASENDDLPF